LAVVAGQLQWIAQDAVLRPAGSLITDALLWVTTRVLPNLQQFNVGDALVLGTSTVSLAAIFEVVASGLIYITAYLVLGIMVFRRREI
jgi:hypothetical protein